MKPSFCPRRWLTCLVGIVCLFAVSTVRADIKLPSLFGDHMVLQQQAGDGSVWFWGRSDWNENVEVRLGTASARAVGDIRGIWACRLSGLPPAGGPYEVTFTGKNTVTLHDVLVGEVWLCSGQSNMGFPVNEARDHAAEVAAADLPQIRLFSVSHRFGALPVEDPKGEWRVCSPGTVGGFSAVGYFFGRQLHQDLRVPVGLIDSSWGGTPAEAWTPLDAMWDSPRLRPVVERYAQQVGWASTERLKVARYDEELTRSKDPANAGKYEGKNAPADPRPAMHIDQNSAGTLYHGMITPLQPFSLRGVIWYQGESNAPNAGQYEELLTRMIQAWWQGFGRESFPFYIVQLANYQDRKPQPADSDWAQLREAQAKVARAVQPSGLAVAIDIGEAGDIHPKNKQEVGHRLALLAEARTYGQKVVDEGPVFAGMQVEGDKVRVSFRPTASALVSRTGEKLRGFAVAGEDRRFAWADAVIEGNEVVVHSNQVPAPVAVRYAWANNPEVSLYNEVGLPASPFRSDDWDKSGALPER